MPWSNQGGGGGWRGGGGGGPWGSSPRGSGGGGGSPPDLEELLRRSQDRLKNILPGGGQGFGGRGLALIAVLALIGWLATGFYRVEPDELGVELVVGKVHDTTNPGLNYNWPYPIGSVFTPQVLTVRETTVGLTEIPTPRGVTTRDIPEESLMLTGDENLVDVDFKVQWNIRSTPRSAVAEYLFNIQNPEATVKAVAESAMREVIGRNDIQRILTEDRQRVEQSVRELMQKTLDEYKAGVDIRLVQMQKVDPPTQVIEAFRDVQAARADQERLQNEARSHANRVLPESEGQAVRLRQEAEAYRDRTILEAKGQASRFLAIHDQYKRAPEVTRQRMYLETMERVLGGTDKVIIDSTRGGAGVVPYLPLDQLTRPTERRPGATQ